MSAEDKGPVEMTREETIAFLEGHEDPCFELAKRLANSVCYESGAEFNALRMWNILNPIHRENAQLKQEAKRLREINGELVKALFDAALMLERTRRGLVEGCILHESNGAVIELDHASKQARAAIDQAQS